MKVVLGGAFGHLGSDVLKQLVKQGHDVVALDLKDRPLEVKGKGSYKFYSVDLTNPETIKGLCDGADVVITTVGLVSKSTKFTPYDIDYQGNLNLLREAEKAGVKNFAYISVIKVDEAPEVPLLDAKAKFEAELKKSSLKWVIFRPTGYFFDIAHVFMPMIKKGKVMLLTRKNHPVNVIDTPDFAEYIVDHMLDEGKTISIGGTEIYTYEEIAKMFFAAAHKKAKISRVPAFLFDLIARKAEKAEVQDGTAGLVRFSKFTLTHDLVGDVKYGKSSFKEYIASRYDENGEEK
jgi:uncharacterized protein YbjT (DUF2867 family)